MGSESWDVIVVGAGIGGLTAAARLRREGARVLVLDRNRHVGGTAFTYRRRGYTFPMGPLGFSSPKKIRDILKALGLTGPTALKRVHYRLRAFGLDVPLSRGFSGLTENLGAGDRDLKAGIRAFFSDMEQISTRLKSGKSPDQGDGSGLLKRAARTPADGYVETVIRDPRWQRILGSIGTERPYSSQLLLAAMWDLMAREGIHYPSGGMAAFCENLAEAVTGPRSTASGRGEIRLGTGVRRISTGRGQVLGVVLENGERESAPAVISNADYKQTFLSLVSPDGLPANWLDQVRSARQTASNLQVSLGLKPDAVELDLFRGTGRVITRFWDGSPALDPPPVDWNRSEIAVDRLLGQEMELCLWSRDDPELAPPGGQVLVIRTPADYDHFARFGPSAGKRIPSYGPYKMRLARGLIDHLEPMIPGITTGVAVLDVATPLTFRDMGGRSRGAVAGWSWDFSDSREQEARELVRSPIRGLYLAGYQALSSLYTGGVPTAMESGLRAAEAVLNRAPPETPDLP